MQVLQITHSPFPSSNARNRTSLLHDMKQPLRIALHWFHSPLFYSQSPSTSKCDEWIQYDNIAPLLFHCDINGIVHTSKHISCCTLVSLSVPDFLKGFLVQLAPPRFLLLHQHCPLKLLPAYCICICLFHPFSCSLQRQQTRHELLLIPQFWFSPRR